MDIERLKELREETEQYRAVADDRCMSTNYEDDLLAIIDEAIARQSVKSEEVTANQPTTRKDRIVDEVAISKTETTSCEWCEICKQYMGKMIDSSYFVFCPHCGRNLKGG